MGRGDGIKFLKALARNPGATGAVLPSSKVLARQMLYGIDFADGHDVLELGPGTGPFTAALESVMPDASRYLGIELNAEFVRLLTQRFPAMRFVEGSAEDAESHLQDAGLDNVRTILSGLPFASLPPVVQDGVIAALDRLMTPGTVFRTFQYVHAMPMPAALRFRKLMRAYFGPHRVSRPVLRNVPPAVVLSWSR